MTYENHPNHNLIHETAVVDINVKMGSGNIIGPFCTIRGDVKLGDDNIFDAHCSIGSPPEHKAWLEKGSWKSVIIGKRNRFSSFTTVDSGTEADTMIGDELMMLAHAHIGHDCVVGDKVTISCGAKIGGHTKIFSCVNVGLNAVIHQHQVIGAYSMIGASAFIPKKLDVWPGMIYVGVPARAINKNLIGIKNHNVTDAMLLGVCEAFKCVRRIK